MVEEVHGGYLNEPEVGDNFFLLSMEMDATTKAGQRMKLDEICVFEVKDGKL